MKLSKTTARQSGRRSGDPRAVFLVIILVLLTGLISYRLFNLTFIRHALFVKSAQIQYNNPSALLTDRGNIYFFDSSSGKKVLAATNKQSYYLYSDNAKLGSAGEAARQLAPILKRGSAELEALFLQDKKFAVVARNLNKSQAESIKSLGLAGLTVALEVSRYYPENGLAAPILGFVGFEGDRRVGQYGIESAYDAYLSGESRTQNVWGNRTYSEILRSLMFWKSDNQTRDTGPADDISGSDIVLTIDPNIQSFVEIKLAALLKKWSATGGSVIVQDPSSGAILAMASSPSFDPNNYASYRLEHFINSNTQEVFEPGSSFKPITMSAAVDSGAVTPETTYNDTGAVTAGGYTIRNFNEKANGIQTMRQVLQHSLNTGAIFAEEKTGDDAFLNYVVNFGFGQKTGVDLVGEVGGNISNLFSGRKINFLTASFGQGIAVTPLQLINAYSAIANGGKLAKPYLVKEIIHADGTAVATRPEILGAPISERTSGQLKSMLVDVVDRGFDKARISGYDVAGKTGTAQIPDPKGGYVGDNQFIHDFVGFAPAYSPRFVILIKMDRPHGIRFAADSLSPVFGEIARYLLRYFNVPPTR